MDDHNKKNEVLSDKFWLNDMKVLLSKDRITAFFPTYKMTLIEKLNSIVRLSI